MTITDIARLAGVSVSTVSKIINNKDSSIHPETRKRVLQIVKDYNYTPYGTVKNISAAKKFLIGVLLRSASRSSLLLNGVLQTAQEHSYGVVLLESGEDPETETKHITALCNYNVDGVLWEPLSEESHANVQFLVKQSIPFCFIDGFEPYPSFRIDFKRMGYQMTEKLLAYKHTNLVCLLKEDDIRSQALYRGFQECLYDHQIQSTSKSRLYISDEECCRQLVANHVTGVVSGDYGAALSLYERMQRQHLNVPFDYSLISLREGASSAFSYPRISGYEVPYHAFGCSVALHLIRLCEKAETEKPAVLFSPELALNHEDSIGFPSAFRPGRFVVVGAINVDVTFHVEQFPRHGNTSLISSSASAVGGKGVNEAIGIARLGNEVALIGKMGMDADAAFIFDLLEREHIVTQGIYRDRYSPTGKAYIYTEDSGESMISILIGANGNLTPEDIHRQQYLFQNADCCVISTEIPIETATCAARTAKDHGIRTIVKPTTLNTLPVELLEYTDIFVPNKSEAAVMCPECGSVEEQAEFFLQRGPEAVIITLGNDGCYLRTADSAQRFSASDVVAIDTTGGADAFIAALASYLGEKYPLEKAIRIAGYAAGFSVSRQGTVGSLIDKGALEALIAQREAGLLG